jgi:hypothetical protein
MSTQDAKQWWHGREDSIDFFALDWEHEPHRDSRSIRLDLHGNRCATPGCARRQFLDATQRRRVWLSLG